MFNFILFLSFFKVNSLSVIDSITDMIDLAYELAPFLLMVVSISLFFKVIQQFSSGKMF